MKGIVFTELLDLVRDKFGIATVEKIIQASDLPSGGAYTAVGTYDYTEILSLVTELSKETSIEAPELVKAFGEYLFGRLAVTYPGLFEGIHTTQELLSHVDDYIHVEVHKLYPHAELPSVVARPLENERLEVTYTSTKPFADLAEGLIRGCAAHFEEEIELEREDLSTPPGTSARFVVHTKIGAETCVN